MFYIKKQKVKRELPNKKNIIALLNNISNIKKIILQSYFQQNRVNELVKRYGA